MIPLPPKIDASVTMMQVEEKPDVTYSDVGGCKEQIERLREVVETPLLNVRSCLTPTILGLTTSYSQRNLSTSVSTLLKVYCCTVHQEPEKPSALGQWPTEQTQPSFV